MQCPQCGFQEFDEHSGCAVCGFQSHAALKTGQPGMKSTEHNLIEFPHKKSGGDIPLTRRDSAVPKVDLPLFNASKSPQKNPEEAAAKTLLWREELQQKLRQYRARRTTPKKKDSLFDSDIAQLEERFPAASNPKPSSGELFAALDETFKLKASAPSVKPVEEKFELPSPSMTPAEKISSPFSGGNANTFELPASVQRIKQQRQLPRRSELFQPSLLFEAPGTAHEAMATSDHVALPISPAHLRERLWAACVDLALIVAVEVICFLPVLWLSLFQHWEFRFGPRLLVAPLASAVVIALVYIFFFTATARKTLGMHFRELNVVNFAGAPPTRKEVLLRTAGYLVSAGSLFLGFIWVFFDVDTLAWHDRISRTYPIHARDLSSDP